jgi:hypothetical protein
MGWLLVGGVITGAIWGTVLVCGGFELIQVQKAITYGWLFETVGRDLHGIQSLASDIRSGEAGFVQTRLLNQNLEIWFTDNWFLTLAWLLAGHPENDQPPRLRWREGAWTSSVDNVANLDEIIAWLQRHKTVLYYTIDELRIQEGIGGFPAIASGGVTTLGASRTLRLEERELILGLMRNLKEKTLEVNAALQIVADTVNQEPEPEPEPQPPPEEEDVACVPGEYRCLDASCIPGEWVCDGYHDCPFSEDEQGCQPEACAMDEFRCQDASCIPGEWVCDGYLDCPDSEDEQECGMPGCSPGDYRCQDGSCVPGEWVCDGYHDCPASDDEQGCENAGCAWDEFRCSDGSCIPYEWVCDEEYLDCPLGEDEEAC